VLVRQKFLDVLMSASMLNADEMPTVAARNCATREILVGAGACACDPSAYRLGLLDGVPLDR
jgi:hypothetical protein